VSDAAWDLVLDNSNAVERVIKRNAARWGVEYAELHADAYMGAHRAAMNFDETRSKAEYWVMLGAHSGVVDALRRLWGTEKKQNARPQILHFPIMENGEPVDFPDTTDPRADILEVADLLNQSSLDKREKLIAWLLAWGFLQHEIAGILGLSPGRISQLVSLIREKIDQGALR
jgi:RNA polymerase sigma factor (sigma-70 family)